MRTFLIHRPLVVSALGLLLGVAAMRSLFASVLLLALLVFMQNLRSAVVCAVAFVLGFVLSPPSPQVLASRQWVDLDATVATVPLLYPTETVAEISIGQTRLMVSAPLGAHLVLGERIHVRGVAKPLSEGSQYLSNRGIVGRIAPTSISVIGEAPWICRTGEAWRESFSAFCEQWLPPQAAAETEAVCFNVSAALDPSSRQSLTRSGTVHVVSASGLHVGLIALLLFWSLALLPIPRWAQVVILSGVLAVYCVASGLHPPVLRASITAIVLAAAYLFRREPDMISALALAAVIQILWDPRAAFDPGFQISFVVVAAFALFSLRSGEAKRTSRERLLQSVSNGLKGTALATAASAPLAAYSFGTVSFTSIFANLALILVLPVMVVAAMLAHLLSYWIAPLGVGLMVGLVGPLAGWLGLVTDKLGGEWAATSVPAFSGYWLLLAYGLVLLLWRPRVRPA